MLHISADIWSGSVACCEELELILSSLCFICFTPPAGSQVQSSSDSPAWVWENPTAVKSTQFKLSDMETSLIALRLSAFLPFLLLSSFASSCVLGKTRQLDLYSHHSDRQTAGPRVTKHSCCCSADGEEGRDWVKERQREREEEEGGARMSRWTDKPLFYQPDVQNTTRSAAGRRQRRGAEELPSLPRTNCVYLFGF